MCYIHNTGMTCPTRCYKKICWYICNMRTYVTNKLRQRVTRKTFYIQNNCQESKNLPFSLLLHYLHPLVLSWNMCSMACPTRCYKKIHCYVCNVRTDVTNKVQRKRLPEKYLKYRTIQKTGLPDCKIWIFKTTMWDV